MQFTLLRFLCVIGHDRLNSWYGQSRESLWKRGCIWHPAMSSESYPKRTDQIHYQVKPVASIISVIKMNMSAFLVFTVAKDIIQINSKMQPFYFEAHYPIENRQK